MTCNGPTAGSHDAVDPQMQPILEAMRLRALSRPPAHELDISTLRRRTADDMARFKPAPCARLDIRECPAEGAFGVRPVRCFRPMNAPSNQLVIWLHGGGFVVGDRDTHAGLAAEIAQLGQREVALPEYVKAPEHPFPQPLEDVTALIDSIIDRKGARQFVLGGDSAGAWLALAAALHRTAHSAKDLAGLVLLYGTYAPPWPSRSYAEFGSGYGIDRDSLAHFWRLFLGGAGPGSDASLFDRDFGALPPVWVGAAGLDPLRDDSERLAAAMAGQGVRVESGCYPGVVHGFAHMTAELDCARQCCASMGTAIGSMFAAHLPREPE